ncbi:MAG: polysaccharide deacetylase family protein [Kiritimatiellia bacterium]
MRTSNPRISWRPAARTLLAGAALAALAACSRPPAEPIPVLMYHHLAPDPGHDVWTVATDEFRRQIAELRAAGYQTVLPGELRDASARPRKPIVITFDDGLLSTLTEAEPILREAGFRAIGYLITGFIADAPADRMTYGVYDCLSWEEVRAMQRRGTFAFGIHSHSHAGQPDRLAQEAAECRRIFQRKTGIETRDFCYPYGAAPNALVQAVAAAGYRTAMICADRLFRPGLGADWLRIPRVSVYGGRHGFSATPPVRTASGAVEAEVRNAGRPLPVRGILRDAATGRAWSFSPRDRLGPAPQSWRWTELPADLDPATLQIEIWEQNGLFRYFP